MTDIINSLKWRYSTKSFNEKKNIKKDDLEKIIESFRLSPSSFGLQPWKLLIIKNKKLKEELFKHTYSQEQVKQAPYLLVFTRIKNITNEYIDLYIEDMAKKYGVNKENLKGYEELIKGFFSRLDEKGKKEWAENQVYISLGIVLATLAEMKIDSCPIGGFNPAEYDRILELDKKNLASVVILPIGYRNENDKYSKYPKIRFEKEFLVEFID